jgi:hypothetical protein
VPDPAPECQAGDARVAERSARRRETVPLSGRVEILPERSSTTARRPRLRIDDDLAHQTQIDDETSVADAMTGDAVTTAADGHRQIRLAREPDGRDDIIDIQRSHDQFRVPLDHSVERGPRNVEVAVGRSYDRSAMSLSELSRRRHAPTLRDLDQLPADLAERCTAGEPKRQIQVGDEILDDLAHA